MKKISSIILAVLLLLSICTGLSACTKSEANASSSLNESKSVLVSSSSNISNSKNGATNDVMPIEKGQLKLYESLANIPYATIEYGEVVYMEGAYETGLYEAKPGDPDRNILVQNGERWAAAPGGQKFGEIAFANAQAIFIPVYFANGNYRWMAIAYEKPLPTSVYSNSYFLPSEADDKMFVEADGDMLLLANGDGFNVSTLQWIENGVVVISKRYNPVLCTIARCMDNDRVPSINFCFDCG